MDENNQKLKSEKIIRKSGKYIRQLKDIYDMCGCGILRREGKLWNRVNIVNYNLNKIFFK